MKRFKLLCHEPVAGDSTSFYRSSGVLGQISETIEWLDIQYVNDYQEWYGYNSRGLFLQRPFTAEHLRAMQLSKAAGNKVWVDYDDALLIVNSENPAYAFYEDPKVKDNIKGIMSLADQITCTTEHLAELIREYNDNVTVIPNALNDRLLKFHDVDYEKPRAKRIFWRGGSSHERDLRQYTDTIIQAVKEFPEWEWDFIGAKFWFLFDEFKTETRVRFTNWMSTLDFHKHLVKNENAVCIVPLADNSFNHAKSNIAWLEASYSGAVALTPDWETWQKPGALHYKDKETFRTQLFSILQDNNYYSLEGKAKESWSYIENNLILSQVNQKRIEVIEKLR